MQLKETEYKKKASLSIQHENGYTLQRECLVSLENGEITIGDPKVTGSKYDPSSKITGMEVHYRGNAYEIETLNKVHTIKNRGLFISESLKPETETEAKFKNVNAAKAAWKH